MVATMQSTDRINAIEQRAADINLSLWRVSQLAGVEYQTLWRWRQGRNSPRLDLFERTMARLEAKVCEIELDIARRAGSRSKVRQPAA